MIVITTKLLPIDSLNLAYLPTRRHLSAISSFVKPKSLSTVALKSSPSNKQEFSTLLQIALPRVVLPEPDLPVSSTIILVFIFFVKNDVVFVYRGYSLPLTLRHVTKNVGRVVIKILSVNAERL
jgi:hypothetical protein